jgi:hypothetical protein
MLHMRGDSNGTLFDIGYYSMAAGLSTHRLLYHVTLLDYV